MPESAAGLAARVRERLRCPACTGRLDSAWCRMARALGRVSDAQLLRYRRATAGSFAFVAYRD